MQEQEIDLFEYLNVLTKHKILIFSFVIISAATAVIITPPPQKIYEVSIIMDANKTDIPMADLLSKINEGAYDEKILNDSGLDLKNSGIKFDAASIGSYMVKVKVKLSEKNTDNAVKAVNGLYEAIHKEQEDNLNMGGQNAYQKSFLASTISENKNEITYLEQKIKLLEDNERKLNAELTEARKKYKELSDSSDSFILNKNQSEKDQSVINYSYVLQQKLNLIDNISSQIKTTKAENDLLRTNVKKLKLENDKLKIEVGKLENGYENFKNVKLLKSPEVSETTTGGNKSAKAMMAGFIGLMVGCFIAFFVEFIKNAKNKIKFS